MKVLAAIALLLQCVAAAPSPGHRITPKLRAEGEAALKAIRVIAGAKGLVLNSTARKPFNIEWESCGGEADQVRVDDILVDPPFGQGESTVEFEGEAFPPPPVPGSAEVRLFFFGLPFATEEIVVCPPEEEDCPYIEGPMRVLFDLDLSILPGGNYGIEYDSVDAVGAPLFCVKFDFTM